MDKTILLSIKPKWVAKILNGEKTVEIRKKFPKDYVGWVYIYCTKDNHQLVKPKDYDKYLLFTKGAVNYSHEQTLNGKVVARFWCDKVDDYVNGRKWSWKFGAPMWGASNGYEYILKDACLTDDELRNYADDLAFNAIHISKLEIFDYPKALSEFSSFRKPYWNKKTRDFIKEEQKKFGCRIFRASRLTPLTKAPQSWMYVEEESQ